MDKIKLVQNEELDSYSYHEMLDRCWIVMSQIQDLLIDHQVSHAHPEIVENLEIAQKSIWEVYQAMGTVEISEK